LGLICIHGGIWVSPSFLIYGILPWPLSVNPAIRSIMVLMEIVHTFQGVMALVSIARKASDVIIVIAPKCLRASE
jgi:hypothetical protein